MDESKQSGHYARAPVNSCSLGSLCFRKRGRRCDHEESPCLFFSNHYWWCWWWWWWGVCALTQTHTFSSLSSPFSAFSPLLPLSLPSLTASPLPPAVIPLLSVLLLLAVLALPAQCSSNTQEGERSMASSERELHS